ncbi:hypothetical protein [Xanthobacter sp. KR7-225]|uniref:hypothetical protein n=1 Tax=Xanthobacter sp. KR7-225 TaxID=3156613 RepID=UPI0032B3633E
MRAGLLAALLGAGGAAAPAAASTPEAWAQLFRAAEAACLAATGLAEARVEGAPVDFSAHVLVLVRGRWPQPHMTGAPPAAFACLYAKADGSAEAHERRLP